jgi:hypothetical protein
MVLSIGPADEEMGTLTSNRCSLPEPHGIDCTNDCDADPKAIPSTLMAYEPSESTRNMVTVTLENEELPGQSTLKPNRVEIANDVEFLRMLWPGAEVP